MSNIAPEPEVLPKYSEALEFKNRQYIRIGTSSIGTYRGVVFLSPRDQIQSALIAAGKGASAGYSIHSAKLTLTTMSGSANIPVRAFMLPLASGSDENIVWQKPSSGGSTYFDNLGGDIEPLSESIVCYGVWDGIKSVSFDITPYMNIWNTTTVSKLGIMITHEEAVPGFQTFFYSSEATTPFIGGAPLTNCKFLGAGASNSISTEGVRIRLVPYGSVVSLELVDTNDKARKYWSAFNAAVATGASFTMRLPDSTTAPSFTEKVGSEGGAMNGYVFSVLDKLDGSILVDEDSSVLSAPYYETAELLCSSTLPSGTGILEFTNPSERLLLELVSLKQNDTININYGTTTATNNARSYTLNFYSNETLLNNRARLYLNEAAVTEDRNGLYTEIKPYGVQPRLDITIQPIAFTEKERREVEA